MREQKFKFLHPLFLRLQKKNPPKESASKALVVEAQGKPLVETKVNDVSIKLCLDVSRPFS
jgi:hypothetical protein